MSQANSGGPRKDALYKGNCVAGGRGRLRKGSGKSDLVFSFATWERKHEEKKREKGKGEEELNYPLSRARRKRDDGRMKQV